MLFDSILGPLEVKFRGFWSSQGSRNCCFWLKIVLKLGKAEPLHKPPAWSTVLAIRLQEKQFLLQSKRFFTMNLGNLALMIRATSSRSSRPNHILRQWGSPKPPRCAAFRRLAGGVHSVEKRLRFFVAFGLRNWSKIEAQSGPKSCFADVFFEHAFREEKMSILGRSRTWKT